MDLDYSRLEELVQTIADRLEGDWLLIGGGLVSLWLDSRRMTQDLDVVSLEGTMERRYALMGLAQDLGLSIETINSAADFFVRQIPGWQDEIEAFYRGKKSTIYRPSPTLFFLLKAGRLSEQDLEDCAAMTRVASRGQLLVNVEAVVQFIEGLPVTNDPGLVDRRRDLVKLLRTL